jgi:hypothetical protein
MYGFNKLTNSICNALNEFIDSENMGLDTKIKSTCVSHTELGATHDLIGGHF